MFFSGAETCLRFVLLCFAVPDKDRPLLRFFAPDPEIAVLCFLVPGVLDRVSLDPENAVLSADDDGIRLCRFVPDQLISLVLENHGGIGRLGFRFRGVRFQRFRFALFEIRYLMKQCISDAFHPIIQRAGKGIVPIQPDAAKEVVRPV